MHRLRALGLAAAAAAVALPPVAVAVPIASGATLQLQPCASGDLLQAFSINAADSTVRSSDGTLCVTLTGASPAALAMLPCQQGDGAQAWNYDASSNVFAQAGSSLSWNAQGGAGVEGQGSLVSTWDSVSFNSLFTANFPEEGAIGYNATSAGNTTFSGLCVTAVNPAPPALPTADQVAWMNDEMGCFIHFNMATMAGSQGCDCSQPPPPLASWQPTALNTDAWIAAGVAMGCKRFIYVAKHNCGFAAWNSSVQGWGYSSNLAPMPVDVVRPFVASCQRAGVKYGFYYSTVTNARANVCSGKILPNPKPGQLNLTWTQYQNFVQQHLTELWGLFGPLAEVWLDGGYPAEMAVMLSQLFAKLQPHVVAFGGQGLLPSPARWMGAESSYPPYPFWSTVGPNGGSAGDPNGAQWVPSESDWTLQRLDTWFYNPIVGVRGPAELRLMYELGAGRNNALIIDFAPVPNGSIPPAQVAAAQTLGAYIRGCYGSAIARTSGSGSTAQLLTLTIPSGAPGASSVDRVVVMEDQQYGHIVRGWTLTGVLTNGSSVTLFAEGSSIGHKYIAMLPAPMPLTSITLNITALAPAASAGGPYILDLSAYSCGALAERLDAEWERWEAAGFEPARAVAA